MLGENALSRPPLAAMTARAPSTQTSSSAVRSASGTASSPRLVCREDGNVDLVAVEHLETPFQHVIAEVDLEPALLRRERDAFEERRGVAGASAATKPSGHRCWWTSYVVTPVVVRADRHGRSSSGSGICSCEVRYGTRSRTKARPAAAPVPSVGTPELDGLGSDHELDRNDSRTEVDHLRQASRSSDERAVRSSTPDSCIVEASSNETGWASSRASAAIAWAATRPGERPSCQVPSVATSPSLRPLNRG